MDRTADDALTAPTKEPVSLALQPPRAMLLLVAAILLAPLAIAAIVYVICVDHHAWPGALTMSVVAAPVAIWAFRLASQRARLLREGIEITAWFRRKRAIRWEQIDAVASYAELNWQEGHTGHLHIVSDGARVHLRVEPRGWRWLRAVLLRSCPRAVHIDENTGIARRPRPRHVTPAILRTMVEPELQFYRRQARFAAAGMLGLALLAAAAQLLLHAPGATLLVALAAAGFAYRFIRLARIAGRVTSYLQHISRQ